MFYTSWNYLEPILHLYSIQGEADRPCAICSDRTVFDRCPKPTASPIFCTQKFDKITFNSVKSPKIALLGGVGRFWKVS